MSTESMQSILAPKHTGMMVDGLRVLRQSFAGSHHNALDDARSQALDHLDAIRAAKAGAT